MALMRLFFRRSNHGRQVAEVLPAFGEQKVVQKYTATGKIEKTHLDANTARALGVVIVLHAMVMTMVPVIDLCPTTIVNLASARVSCSWLKLCARVKIQ